MTIAGTNLFLIPTPDARNPNAGLQERTSMEEERAAVAEAMRLLLSRAMAVETRSADLDASAAKVSASNCFSRT